MKRCRPFLLAAMLIFAVVSFISGQSQEPHKKVLLISAYNAAFPTFENRYRGVLDGFAGRNVEVDVEFLDSKRLPSQEIQRDVADLLVEKLLRLPNYDGIIASDDNALRLVMELKSSLWPDTPLAFMGINDWDYARDVSRRRDTSGVIEKISIPETLDLMLELFPETEVIYVISDRAISGQLDLVSVMAYADRYPLTELSIKNQSFGQFALELAQLQGQYCLLLLSALQDGGGTTRSFSDSLQLIYRHSNAPIFHLWDYGLGDGIFGGKLINQYEQGRVAASMLAADLFDNHPIGDQPMIEQATNMYMFDYRQLERFAIPRWKLPPDSKVIEVPSNFFLDHIALVSSVLAVIIALSLLALLLYRSTRRMQTLATQLKESEIRFRNLFQFSPLAYLEEDFSAVKQFLDDVLSSGDQALGGYFIDHPNALEACARRIQILDVNHAALRLFRVSGMARLQNDFHRAFSGKGADLLRQKIIALYSGREQHSALGELKDLNGAGFWTNMRYVLPPGYRDNWARVYTGLENLSPILETQTRLRDSLKEKEVLIREIHHRVNNNLAMISSFLHLEMLKGGEPADNEALQNSIFRIKAMALVHQKLYSSHAAQSVEVKQYILELLSDVVLAYNRREQEVNLDVVVEGRPVRHEYLMPMGLIINEVVSNAMKHAFSQTDEPSIEVRVNSTQAEGLFMSIRDNGSGFGEEEIRRARERKSMGMLIIESLAAQLQANIQFSSDEGSSFEFRIPN